MTGLPESKNRILIPDADRVKVKAGQAPILHEGNGFGCRVKGVDGTAMSL